MTRIQSTVAMEMWEKAPDMYLVSCVIIKPTLNQSMQFIKLLVLLVIHYMTSIYVSSISPLKTTTLVIKADS